MDLIRMGCFCLASDRLESVLFVIDQLGLGVVAGTIATAIFAYGAWSRRKHLRQAGLAGLLAVVVAGGLSNLLKLAFQMPRPDMGYAAYGFPSGHTSVAFAFAAALGEAFPAAAPLLYLVAVLVGLSRMYYRTHFAIDVVGGILLGTVVGRLIAQRLVTPLAGPSDRPYRRWLWLLPAVAGAAVLIFFSSYERALEAHRPEVAGLRASIPGSIAIEFGSLEARPLLLRGWSGDERWKGRWPVVWAEGLEASVRLPSLPALDHRIRLLVRPYLGHRLLSCQTMKVAVNDVPVARVLLAGHWQEYEIRVPGSAFRPAGNEMRFRFAYAESPARTVAGGDPRRLSVAFATLEAFRDQRPPAP
jgi:uncharacterized membrane protein YeaQ/YmgE (transglycosylase-associated protein family)